MSCKWDLLLVGNDDADAVIELDMKVTGGELGEIDLDVADVLDGPRFGML